MNKILYPSLLFTGIMFMSFININTNDITIQSLSKKWTLSHYSVGWFTEEPSQKEKNDYIHLSSNMTFTSISEGVFEKGTWTLKGKRIILSKNKEKESLTFIVEELTNKELVLIIDDPSDPDAKYLNIHFKN